MTQELKDFEIVMCVLGSTCGISCIIIGVFICLTYYHNGKWELISSIKWSLLAVLMFSITSLGIVFYYSLLCISPYLTITLLLSWTFGTNFVYILFLKRFQKIFAHTKYDTFSSNMIWVRLFYLLCVLFIVADIVSKLLYVINVTDYQYNIYTLIITIFQQCIDFILSYGLVLLFVKKLKLLSADIEHCKRGSKYIQNQIQYEISQRKIFHLQSKISLLATVTIVSSQIYLSYKAVMFVLESFYDYDVSDIELFIFDGYLPIDCFINTMCVFLSMDNIDLSKKCYKLLCCHKQWINLFKNQPKLNNELKLSIHSGNNLEMKLSIHSGNNLEMKLLEDDTNHTMVS
eukprot:277515_1